ncbi:hypothetical protein QYF36_011339 [Acer negundo]|nr:hypothetical protein QYF36_011339 [Acer negundo]
MGGSTPRVKTEELILDLLLRIHSSSLLFSAAYILCALHTNHTRSDPEFLLRSLSLCPSEKWSRNIYMVLYMLRYMKWISLIQVEEVTFSASLLVSAKERVRSMQLLI